jgi:hypothetical protein
MDKCLHNADGKGKGKRTRKGKGKAIPFQVSTGFEGSRRLRFPFFKAERLSALRTGRLYHQDIFLVLVFERLSRPQGHSTAGRINKNRTRDFAVCSAVPQPTAPPRTPNAISNNIECQTSIAKASFPLQRFLVLYRHSP